VRLVALTDTERFPQPTLALEPLCQAAVPGSVAIVLRDRQAPLSKRLELGRALRAMTATSGQVLLVSDRVDLALELEADGVHLPAGGLLPSQALALFPDALLSRAHHDADELPSAELERCTLLLVSPALAERKGRPPLGPDGLGRRLAELRQKAPEARLLALGGVDARTVSTVLGSGADGVAAVGAAHDAAEQAGLVRALGIARVG